MDALTTEGDARKRRQTAGCNAGTAKAYRRGLVEAAARDSEHFRGWNGFKGFEHLKAGKRQA